MSTRLSARVAWHDSGWNRHICRHPAANTWDSSNGGGANNNRCWLWKWHLQQLADEFSLTITVAHYPTGASKWNPIEYCLFCHISRRIPTCVRDSPRRPSAYWTSTIGSCRSATPWNTWGGIIHRGGNG